MGKDRFSIQLDGSTDSYYPKNVISGYLKMELHSPMTIKGINGNLEGCGYVEFTTGAGENSITFNASESYCLEKKVLLEKGSTELQKGEHRYPFSFQLPLDVPSSFESSQAYIRYYLNIVIERSLLKFNKVVRRIVSVNYPLDLNDVKAENLMNPSESNGSKTICCLFCKSGPISAKLKTDRKGYVPGDTIIVNGEITNMSNRPINEVKITLKMFVTLRAGPANTAYCNKLGEIKLGAIDPGDTSAIINETLLIPAVISSGRHGYSIIEVLYVVELAVVPVGLSLDLSLLSPIIVGGIPLVEVASRYGVTIPFGPDISSGPTELYSESNFIPPPQASFVESVFGDVKMKKTKKAKEEEKDDEVENVPFVPKYLYYKWNNQNPVELFPVNKV